MKYCKLIVDNNTYSFETKREAELTARIQLALNPFAEIRIEENVKSDLDKLHLSSHTRECLAKAGILSIADVDEHECELLKVRNLGRKGVDEVLLAMADYRMRKWNAEHGMAD